MRNFTEIRNFTKIIKTKIDQEPICVKDKSRNYKLWTFGQGGSYNVFVKLDQNRHFQSEIIPFEIIVMPHNNLSILYQLPQYILLTMGEVMFSIPSLQFAYSQVIFFTDMYVREKVLIQTSYKQVEAHFRDKIYHHQKVGVVSFCS